MPELPDIEVFAVNLKLMLAGKKLTKVCVVNGKKLKDIAEELQVNLQGCILQDIYRSGKEFRFKFSNGNILGLHLMLTGDIFPFQFKNEHKFTIVEFHFADSSGIALTDRMRNANVKLNPVDKKGVDALDVNYKSLKEILTRKAKIKDILMDQNLIRGIGNGYSDEILWMTRINPYSVAEAIPEEKIRELATTIRKCLKDATKQILKAYPV